MLKDSLKESICSSTESVCGELPSVGTYSFNVSSCIYSLYIYALKSEAASKIFFTAKFEYLGDKCRGKNATISEKCGSLGVGQCRSETGCDLDCQQVNCSDSVGNVLHQLCLPSFLSQTQLLSHCQSYHGTFPRTLDFDSLETEGKVATAVCKAAEPGTKIGTLGIVLMVLALAVLLVIAIMAAYYNCNVQSESA